MVDRDDILAEDVAAEFEGLEVLEVEGLTILETDALAALEDGDDLAFEAGDVLADIDAQLLEDWRERHASELRNAWEGMRGRRHYGDHADLDNGRAWGLPS